jgi:hypothetical protein
MLNVRVDGVSQVPLTDWDDAIEALTLDRSYKPLRIRIQVRTPWREFDGAHSMRLEHINYGLGEERISVMDQVLVVTQESIEPVELAAQRVAYPLAVRLITDTRDLDAASSEINHKEHMEPGEPFPCPNLDGEEVHRGDDTPVNL